MRKTFELHKLDWQNDYRFKDGRLALCCDEVNDYFKLLEHNDFTIHISEFPKRIWVTITDRSRSKDALKCRLVKEYPDEWSLEIYNDNEWILNTIYGATAKLLHKYFNKKIFYVTVEQSIDD